MGASSICLLRADRAAGCLDSARRAAGDTGPRVSPRAGSFRSELSRCRRLCLPAGACLGPPQLRECDARRMAPRCARHPTARSARRAVWMRRVFTRAKSSLSFCPHSRGVWADGGVPRAAGVRRRACQARQGGGPGSERPEGTTSPLLSAPARKLRARREHFQPNGARRDGREVEVRRRPTRRRREPGRSGAREDLDDQAQETTRPTRRRRGVHLWRPGARRWHSPPSSAFAFRPAFCRIWQATCLYTVCHLPRWMET
jgi:hypothetical protein